MYGRCSVFTKKKRSAAAVLLNGAGGELAVSKQMHLIRADVLRPKLVRRLVEVAAQTPRRRGCRFVRYSERNYDAGVLPASFFVSWVTGTSL